MVHNTHGMKQKRNVFCLSKVWRLKRTDRETLKPHWHDSISCYGYKQLNRVETNLVGHDKPLHAE